MIPDLDTILNAGLDDILFQLSKGNTIDGLKKGLRWDSFEQVKEWKLKFGYKFHIYSNDHPIDKKPHFHLVNQSNNIDCRFFFDGTLHDCKCSVNIEKKVTEALGYFLSQPHTQSNLIAIWNLKNPQFSV